MHIFLGIFLFFHLFVSHLPALWQPRQQHWMEWWAVIHQRIHLRVRSYMAQILKHKVLMLYMTTKHCKIHIQERWELPLMFQALITPRTNLHLQPGCRIQEFVVAVEEESPHLHQQYVWHGPQLTSEKLTFSLLCFKSDYLPEVAAFSSRSWSFTNTEGILKSELPLHSRGESFGASSDEGELITVSK